MFGGALSDVNEKTRLIFLEIEWQEVHAVGGEPAKAGKATGEAEQFESRCDEPFDGLDHLVMSNLVDWLTAQLFQCSAGSLEEFDVVAE
jgi:hypothetical protein